MKINKYKENINKLINHYGEDDVKNGSAKLITEFGEELSRIIKDDKPKKELIGMIARIEIMLDQIKEIYNIENNNILPTKIKNSNDLVEMIKLHNIITKDQNAENK